jgi:hypothetical protein
VLQSKPTSDAGTGVAATFAAPTSPGLPALHARRALRSIVAGMLRMSVYELAAGEEAGRTYGALGRERGVSVNEVATAIVTP